MTTAQSFKKIYDPVIFLDERDPVEVDVVNKQLQLIWDALLILQVRIEELERDET